MRRHVLRPVLLLLVAALLAASAAPVAAMAPAATPAALRPAGAVWPGGAEQLAIPTQRVAGADRYATAAAIARETYPGWAGVHDVVVASGDDRAAADPLAAASLCWAYDAPLLLVNAGRTPADTRLALAQIVSVNTTVTVHVVGGTGSVPSTRIAELRAIVGSTRVEQPWKTGGRYALAAGIAARTRAVAQATSRTVPAAAIVANGADATRFYDALAASAVSRHTGVPILLSGPRTVPSETLSALAGAGWPETIVVGGTGTLSGAVYTTVRASSRWAGDSRYSTAAAIARNAVIRGWSDGGTAGVAAKLPDALTGAGLVGRSGGTLLLTTASRLEWQSWSFLLHPPAPVSKVYVLGGPASVLDAQVAEIAGAPALAITGPSTPGPWTGKTMHIAGVAGSNTTTVAAYLDGSLLGETACPSWGAFDLGTFAAPAKGTLTIVASNPEGLSSRYSFKIARLNFPYPTCIIVDKSEYKLFWVKDNLLVKVYPIAIGREGMETPLGEWKILAKYYTDPTSVYGPRKMRMFRKVGSSYVFTAYAIHGTNQEWVIGSKASHGCIRMYNRDVLELFPQVPLGTPVITRQ